MANLEAVRTYAGIHTFVIGSALTGFAVFR